MTDGGTGFQPDEGEASVQVRPRSAFVAHEVFGHGADAVLVEPEVARDLRNAAEFASQERRIAGGLVYGRRWTDDEGPYLVVDGYLEAGPGENRDDRIDRDGRDSFALSDTDLRVLREDAERMYSAARFEVGWWRSRPGPGGFSPRDLESQRRLVAPGGVGLLVFGAGLEWGTAYLGPDGEVPGSARSFIPVPRPAAEPPRPQPASPGPVPVSAAAPELEAEPDEGALDGDAALGGEAALQPAAGLVPEPVGAAAPGASLATRQPRLTPPPIMSGPPMVSPINVTAKEWASNKAASASYVGPETPTDVKIVVGALIAAAIVAAVLIGVLLSNILVAVIAALVLLLGLSGFLWMSRL